MAEPFNGREVLRLTGVEVRRYSVYSEKSSLPTPHTGQTQSSGMSSKAVPAAMPPSGSPHSWVVDVAAYVADVLVHEFLYSRTGPHDASWRPDEQCATMMPRIGTAHPRPAQLETDS